MGRAGMMKGHLLSGASPIRRWQNKQKQPPVLETGITDDYFFGKVLNIWLLVSIPMESFLHSSQHQ